MTLKSLSTILVFSFYLLPFALPAGQVTPFTGKMYNADGTPQTNSFFMSAYPPVNKWTLVGTNLIYGGGTIIITPDATGYFTNNAAANTYSCLFTNYDSGFFVTLPNSSLAVNFPDYITNIPVIPGVLANGYAIATNLLGFGPATNSFAGISYAAGFVIATNNGPIAYSQLPFTPPTNTYDGISNVVQFLIATNGGPIAVAQLPYIPATNSYPGISNAVGFLIATNGGPIATSQLPYMPATNSNAGILSALGYTPPTNSDPRIVLAVTNLSSIGISNAPAAWLVTNGFQVWLSLKTNAAPGDAWTNLPNGSLCTTTNGQLFNLSNSIWLLK